MLHGSGTATGEKAGTRVLRPAPATLAALVVLVAGAALVVHYWTWASAQARAVVVLTSVLETPVLSPAVAGLTGEPVLEDVRVAGVPTLVARPPGEGPWPALIFGNGAVPPGRREPTVERLALGLARAGYLVYVPDVPGLKSGEISERTAAATADVALAAADNPHTRDGRVGLVGVSVGASLALLAAGDERLKGRVSVVSAVAPYADLRDVLRLATTDTYEDDSGISRYDTPDYLRLVAARSLVSALPPGEDRKALLGVLPELEPYYEPGGDEADPLANLPAFRAERGGDLAPAARKIVDLLVNEDPERFDDLYAALSPETREAIRELSPASGVASLPAPVEIASAPRDLYFPLAGSRDLADSAPDGRLTVTSALSHANPRPSLDDARALLRLNGFVVRSLRHARAERPEPRSSEPRAASATETGPSVRTSRVAVGTSGVISSAAAPR